MDATIKTTGREGNERARHERHAWTADFIERVRVNQQKLTSELTPTTISLFADPALLVRWLHAGWRRNLTSACC